jgi:mRNA-degrading endonuclease RelE of RelBE toxin-antitoxin system
MKSENYNVIIFRESVFKKDIQALSDPDQLKIFKMLEKLKNPFEQDIKIKKLKNYPVCDYRLRCGNYRILFNIIESEKEVHILRVRHRGKLY